MPPWPSLPLTRPSDSLPIPRSYVEEPPEEGEGEGEDEAAAALVTKDDGRPEGSVRQRMAAAAADGATAAAAAAKEESKEEEAAEEAAVAEPKKDK